MKFLVLCIVAFFAPNLIDNGDPRAPTPQFEDRQALPAEEAPTAGPAEPGDPDQRRIFKRRPRKVNPLLGRLRTWIRQLRDARQQRSNARPGRRPRGRDHLEDANQPPPAPPRRSSRARPLLSAKTPQLHHPMCTLDR
ncbi:hypothetical protein LCGC14_1195170 [marine sediment metagenome]|uniref:Uncharacterized protein n=1 Tax=marine sediment metagenome TaxID=412755 RepID=A0A0F9LIN4_9ZZZZ